MYSPYGPSSPKASSVASKAGSSQLSAAARKIIQQQGEVGTIIAPGGAWAKPDEMNVRKYERYARSVSSKTSKATSYDRAYPGLVPAPEDGGYSALQFPVQQGPQSVLTHEPTHKRIFEYESPAMWREEVNSYTRRPGEREEVLAAGALAQYRRQVVDREEHERRWRRWQKAKSRKSNPDEATASQVSGTVASTGVASTAPAGMRPAKVIENLADGQRIALFGEDAPKPIWTTMANAPWLDREEAPRSGIVEPPWGLDNVDATHPLHKHTSARGAAAAMGSGSGAASARGSGSARLLTPRVERIVALSARGTSDTKPAGPAAGAAASPEEQQARAERKRGSRTGSEAKSVVAFSLARQGEKVLRGIPETKPAGPAAGATASAEEQQARGERKTGSRTGSEAKSGLASSVARQVENMLAL